MRLPQRQDPEVHHGALQRGAPAEKDDMPTNSVASGCLCAADSAYLLRAPGARIGEGPHARQSLVRKCAAAGQIYFLIVSMIIEKVIANFTRAAALFSTMFTSLGACVRHSESGPAPASR